MDIEGDACMIGFFVGLIPVSYTHLQREAGISNGMPASIYFRIILGKIGSNKLFSPSVGVRFILQFQQILQFFKHILLKFGTKLTE